MIAPQLKERQYPYELPGRELVGVILFAVVCTVLMIFINAYERLYLFTRMYGLGGFGEFSVFFPSCLAIGFALCYYRRMKELESEIHKRKKAEQSLQESEKMYRILSVTDDLTRLFNSRYFHQKFRGEINRSSQQNDPLSVIMMDIDNFKRFNDQHGHIEGDKALSLVGEAIRTCIRRSDSAFRYGGEEFVIILPNTKTDNAVQVAERIRSTVEAKFSSRSSTRLTLSLGVGQYQAEENPEAFLKRVDEMLYQAKKWGKNRVSFFETHEDASESLSVPVEL